MKDFLCVVVLLSVLVTLSSCSDEKKARLETCGGWRLNSLPKVKSFINNHLPQYGDVEIKYIGGKDPEMVFLDGEGNETERVSVIEMSEDDIIELLASKGIVKTPDKPSLTDREDL